MTIALCLNHKVSEVILGGYILEDVRLERRTRQSYPEGWRHSNKLGLF